MNDVWRFDDYELFYIHYVMLFAITEPERYTLIYCGNGTNFNRKVIKTQVNDKKICLVCDDVFWEAKPQEWYVGLDLRLWV